MPSKFTSEYGNIVIDEDVIAQISGIIAMECYGIVGMAARNVKDGIVHLLKGDSLTRGVAVRLNENNVSIDFHIVVEYGTKISAVADNLMSTVKYKVKDILGIDVEHIKIFIEGVRVDKE
ncbi:Asp23/Gls24 family envelope stress response protein [Cellulosilyticum sp. I15G10I2]|uniref:Asp23/Gls24 family envelope stress response protein n=1 Tax=Cellulosilyticum sp. I15G10I2 TaxID=1892843 RepID=UPI00085CAB5D|nr:Asp23/Gls24 family envelope stress response protein [Cellulosilyticum sp. I15G10I2]